MAWWGFRCAVLPGWVLLLHGCAFVDVKDQIAQIESVCVLGGTISGGEHSAPPYTVVALEAEAFDGAGVPKVIDHVVTGPGGHWFFALPPGHYRIAALGATHLSEGNNVDNNPQTYACEPGERIENVRVALASPGAGPSHLFEQALLERRGTASDGLPTLGRVSAFGSVTALDDSRFEANVASGSLWRPVDFIRDGHAGVYFLEAYDANRVPVLFIHGINGSPRDFRELASTLDRERFQAWFFYYPSGLALQSSARYLAQLMEELEVRYHLSEFNLVAHSMGGLLARAYLNERERRESVATVSRLITLSTPWNGHAAARHGVAHAPAVVPVWRDMAPGSDFLETLFEREVADRLVETDMHLVFGYRSRGLESSPSDGVVTLQSMLAPRAQFAASSVFAVNTTHTGILEDALAIRRVMDILSGD